MHWLSYERERNLVNGMLWENGEKFGALSIIWKRYKFGDWKI